MSIDRFKVGPRLSAAVKHGDTIYEQLVLLWSTYWLSFVLLFIRDPRGQGAACSIRTFSRSTTRVHVEAMLYYVMPYVMGETLRIRMHRERQMGVEAACAIARETADALAYAHGQGIVHRDIKPENILLSGGHAMVADFGIARAINVGGVRQLTMTGVAGPGTPAYMSPEQLLGDRAVDARSDIYSLGCVLYEMLAGKPPFPGKDGFVKRFTEPPPHISSLRRDAPPWVDDVLGRALAKDPDDRYRTAGDFVTALAKPVTTVRPPTRETFLRNALASPPMFESDPLEAQELSRGVSRFISQHGAQTA